MPTIRNKIQRTCEFIASILFESAKLRAWRTCVLACFACLRACVFTCLAYLHVYVLACLACLRTYVLACLRACVLGVLAYLRACMLGMFACFRACVPACLYLHALLTCFLWCMLGLFSIDVLTFLSNYLFCLNKSRLCN